MQDRSQMQRHLRWRLCLRDENWEKFEENFNLVYDNYMKKLCERFPQLKIFDRKLCAYLRMGLSSKEMASLLNTSVRSIETARYAGMNINRVIIIAMIIGRVGVITLGLGITGYWG